MKRALGTPCTRRPRPGRSQGTRRASTNEKSGLHSGEPLLHAQPLAQLQCLLWSLVDIRVVEAQQLIVIELVELLYLAPCYVGNLRAHPGVRGCHEFDTIERTAAR